ncbi:MAG TPA: Hsp20/alpha crystallin family protein [Spirochaetota bacterium]|nr:Hsp20/alpha crystallin family protein [Spirochaetota bacterium]
MKWGLSKRENKQNQGIDSFRREIQNLFDDFFTVGPSSLFDAAWAPSIDIEESDTAIHIKAEVPGIEEKNLSVSIENNMLIISGEKNEERKEEGTDKRYVVSERRFGSFHRSIQLPENIKSDKISAKFKNGVLAIDIPKDETAQPKMITIDVH